MKKDIREKVLGLRLSPEIHAQLQQRADRLGIPKATLGTFIIGQFLYQQEYVVSPAIKSMCESISTAMVQEMKGMESIIEDHAFQIADEIMEKKTKGH